MVSNASTATNMDAQGMKRPRSRMLTGYAQTARPLGRSVSVRCQPPAAERRSAAGGEQREPPGGWTGKLDGELHPQMTLPKSASGTRPTTAFLARWCALAVGCCSKNARRSASDELLSIVVD